MVDFFVGHPFYSRLKESQTFHTSAHVTIVRRNSYLGQLSTHRRSISGLQDVFLLNCLLDRYNSVQGLCFIVICLLPLSEVRLVFLN